MSLKIYHNPRCSKSRNAVNYLQDKNIDFQIIEYLKTGLNPSQIKEIVVKGSFEIKDFLRIGEKIYKEKNVANIEGEKLEEILIENPILLERPIIVSDNWAVIARPLENLIEKIEND
jgi:arsenate reductase (glutaredoxin)